MNSALVGNTGFVGSNLSLSNKFTQEYHSVNITKAYGTHPDLLVYAGLRAEKYLANQFPEEDKKNIEVAFQNIQKIAPRKLVLISTVDVYHKPLEVNEDSVIETEGLPPYGRNRYLLEEKVREAYQDALIIRLPGLYGKNLKKNFLYDMIHRIPSLLKKEKFLELAGKEHRLNLFYSLLDNGYYRCRSLSAEEDRELKELFQSVGFSALNFTDSRAVFQFYNLKYLWNHIETALENGITLINMAAEPVSAAELYNHVTGEIFSNPVSPKPPVYDFRTKYARIYGGENGYLFRKEQVLNDVREFVLKELADICSS